jgi:hypothetical protein
MSNHVETCLQISTLILNANPALVEIQLNWEHREYIRIDITTVGRGHGRVCLADGNYHISPFVNFVCQGKFTKSVPQTKVDISKQFYALQIFDVLCGDLLYLSLCMFCDWEQANINKHEKW